MALETMGVKTGGDASAGTGEALQSVSADQWDQTSPQALVATVAITVAAVVAFGLLGALAMVGPLRRARRRRAARCGACRRSQRWWTGVTATLAVLTLTGAGVRAAHEEPVVPRCAASSIDGSTGPLAGAHRHSTPGVGSRARAALAAPASGLAIAYSRVRGQTICDLPRPRLMLTVMPGAMSTGGSTIGDVFVTPLRPDLDPRQIEALARHEARHTDQWAVATALGGVTLLPFAYALDESLYPGSLNHFEQSAGLAGGGYPQPPSPSPGPRPWALAAWLLVLALVLRRRIGQLVRSLAGRQVAQPASCCRLHPAG